MENYYASIDIWVDRIGLGFYGFSAIEAAAMGIPVITQISEDASTYVPDCPFINAMSKQHVQRQILRLVEDDDLRRKLGAQARDYVIKTHDSLICAKKCLEKYQAMYHE
jgi:glycosyltransferase involved in cell wall biosynthesis